jgi:hypothetical protein
MSSTISINSKSLITELSSPSSFCSASAAREKKAGKCFKNWRENFWREKY